ncbi:putative vitamin B6 transporter [Talaromyces proteolyticus]|uniref:Vitamin B6 transporter n=1 Tax=Talaromyces proteolyticus TaxID=1131652 RepID=A0AAD4KH80_9EURO|nr:putative vitamin B6 transporter [Talaromyces proteolyticus]KAH8690292.1 putative vitamin B6 transporter [Talaromyces proteolyticus]
MMEEGKDTSSVGAGPEPASLESQSSDSAKSTNVLTRLNQRITSVRFLEARGIERVPESERHDVNAADYMQMTLLWFSTNITANNIALGMLGPISFDLGFVDAALCATFGSLLGAAGAAYMGTWGPASGNRTMLNLDKVVARYFMGYWPSKICALLNIVIMLGYGMIDCLVGGQVLSAVADGNMSIVVGTIIVAIITWAIVVFGMSIFHIYERWAWIPQLIALFVLVGSAGPKFDTFITSSGDARTVAGNRLSFLSLCLSGAVAWAPAGADYYVYYPPTTKKWKTFTMTFLGIGLALVFATLLGVGLASGTFANADWAAANEVSSGALILEGYSGLGGFGKFLGVLVSLGLVANNIPGTYSASLGFQVLGRYGARLPRWFWSCISVIIYTACALGGRNHLYDIFENFLALMGYWVTIFLTIALEEHLLFRRPHRGFDWSAWSDPSKLPLGLAAFTAFVIGWIGSIMCMYQIYYVGPIAKLASDEGADLGIWVGCSWAMIVFPPLRWLELKQFGR